MKRIVLFALLCVLAPFAASAQGVRYDNIAFATRGVPLPNPTVTVCTSAGSGQPCTPTATVYTNSTLTTAASNPLPVVAIGQVSTGAGVDAAGNYGFWAPPGRYVLTISGSGVQTPITMTVTLPCDSTVTACQLGTVTSLTVAGNATAASVTDTGLTSGNCVQATTGGQLTTSSGPCGTSSGTITATGSPASGNLTKFSGPTSITNADLSGDCTTTGTLAVTCGKTNGTAFAPSATTDTTNASNIASGTLAAARVAQINLAASGNGGVGGNLPVGNLNGGTNADSSHFWRGDGAWATIPASGPTSAYLTSNYTNTGTVFTSVTGLSFSVSANTKYRITCDLDYQASANGIQIQWTGPASPTFVTYDATIGYGSTSVFDAVATAFSTALQANNVASTSVNFVLRTTMTLSNGSNAGTVQLQAAGTGISATVTILPGSCSLQQ